MNNGVLTNGALQEGLSDVASKGKRTNVKSA